MKLPIIERPIDNTALSTFMRCPREYKWSMIDGYRTKEVSQALSYGAFWHRLLETHYKTGADPQAVAQTFADYYQSVPSTGDYRTAQRALLDHRRYVNTYDPLIDCVTTIGFPNAPMVEISTAIASDNLVHEYAGKIDRIIMIGDHGYIEDHKTTSRLDKHYFKQFDNSNQMKGYVWMARQLLPDVKIVGARINLAHVLTNKTEFHRHIVTYSDSVISEWEQNTNAWLHNMERTIESGVFPGHFGDDGCRRMYGRCQYFDICASNPSIRQQVLEQEFQIFHWDPLAIGDTDV